MTPRVLDWPAIASVLPELELVSLMEAAFDAYSAGQAVIPPGGEPSFDSPPGDAHIQDRHLHQGPRTEKPPAETQSQ